MSGQSGKAKRKAYIVARTHGDSYTTRRTYNRSSSLGGPALLGGGKKPAKMAHRSGK